MSEAPLAAARELRELILEHRDDTESQRQLAAPIVEALVESKLCRLPLPAALGGLEVRPVEAFEVYEELAAAEASVAWVAWNNSLVCWFARYLSPEVCERVFGDPRHLFTSSTRASGRAVAEGEGYLVNGRWSLVSGCLHADWMPVLCLVEANGEVEMLGPDTPHMRMALVPRERFEILDTWHSGGLRGSGSHDVVLENVHVPAEHTFVPFSDTSHLESRFARVPIVVTMAAGCASICLGIARTTLQALVEAGRGKVPAVDGGPAARERPHLQALVARTDARLKALRSHLFDRYAALWDGLDGPEPASAEALAGVWSAAVVTALECRSAVTEAYAAAGVDSLYTTSPIERAHRDIHAVTQHIAVQPFWLEQAGRVALGLEPTHPLFPN